MAQVKKYLRVGGDANNLKDYEFCRITDRHCTRHVHIEKIPAAVKIDWSDNAAVFAAVQKGEVSLDDFNAFIEQSESNAGNKQYEDGLYLLGRLRTASSGEIAETVASIDDPNVISRLVEDVDKLDIDLYRNGSKVELLYQEILSNPNTPSNIQNELLDKSNSYTIANVAERTEDTELITKIFNSTEDATVYGKLLQNDNATMAVIEGALDKYPGLFVEYNDKFGFNPIAEKYAIEFYKNPIVSTGEDGWSASRIYRNDSYDGYKTNRKEAAERLLFANSDYNTLKDSIGGVDTDLRLINGLSNTTIPMDAFKEEAQYTHLSSKDAIEKLSGRSDATNHLAKLAGSSVAYVPEALTDYEKAYVVEYARKKNVPSYDISYQDTMGKYFSSEEQYKKLVAATAEGKDIHTPAYKTASTRLRLANRWKDILKVRSVLGSDI